MADYNFEKTPIGFDVDKMDTDTHLLLEQYHIFSKTPAAPTTTLGGARNKAGHTTTTADVWAEEIPAFFKAYSNDDLTRFAGLAKKNDLVLLAYTKSETEPNGAVLKFTNDTWTLAHTAISAIPDGTVFKNSEDKDVIRFHQNSAAVILSGDNNNTDGSNGFSAKICAWDEVNEAPFAASAMKFVPQFVSPMDKMVNGIPSSGYDAIVKVGTTENDILAESPSSAAGYIANNYAGVIHFNTARADGDIYVHAFEYIGKKLDSEVARISAAVFGTGGDNPEQTTDLVTQVNLNTAAIKTLNSGATTSGSVLHSIESKVSALNSTENGSNGISVTQTKGVVSTSVTVATVDEDGEITAGESNVVTASDAKAIADKAASDAITTALADAEGSVITEKIESKIADATLEGKISDDTDSTQLVTAEQVVTYVSENAKVTLTAATAEGSTGITIDPNGSESTSFTIGIDQAVIATKKYVGDSIAALSAADGVITTLTKTVNTAQQNAAASQTAAEKAETASKAAQAAAEAAQGQATTAEQNAAASQAAAEAAQGEAAQSAADAAQSASDAAGSAADADASAKAAAASEAAATASQAAAENAADDAEAAAADAAAAKTTVEGFEATLNAASLNKSGTLEGKFTITTEGTVKGGLTKIEITDAGLGTLITDAQTQADKGVADAATAQKAADDAAAAVTTLETTDIAGTSVTGAGITVTLGGKVGTPALSGSVATASYTKAAGETPGSWTNDSNVVTGATVKDALADVASAHSKDIQAIQQTLNGLTTTGLKREIAASKEAVTEPAANVIYLIPEDEVESGTYVEYLYVDGTWEAIGTTSTDLAEYAKTDDITPLITAAQEAADAAQADVDALEIVVSTVSQTHASDKAALEASIAAVSAMIGDDSVATQIDDAIKALDVAEHGSNGIKLSQTDGKVAITVTADTVVTPESHKVVTSGAVAAAVATATSTAGAAVEAVQRLAQAAQTAAEGAQATAESKVESITTSDSRITLTPSTTNKVKSVEIALAGTVATIDGDDDAAGTVYTKTQVDTLVGSAKPANYVTAVKVGETTTSGEATVVVEAKTEATHFGSELISASLADSKVTITAAPTKEWSLPSGSEHKPASTITSVINGKMSDGSTIDDSNFTGAEPAVAGYVHESLFGGCESLTTYVGDLDKLVDGQNMFDGCTSLTTFIANLGSLKYGYRMFSGCKLSEESLMYIVDSLPENPNKGIATIAYDDVAPEGYNTLYYITVDVAEGVDKTPYIEEASTKGWTLI